MKMMMELSDRVENVSRDYLGLVDKVNDKLRTLRADLISMRRQDVKLLKQLVNINDVIQAMYQRAKEIRSDEDDEADEPQTMRPTDVWRATSRRTPLVRQQSVPYYCGAPRTFTATSMGDSMEGLDEIADDDPSLITGDVTDDTDSLFSSSGAITVPSFTKHYIRQRAISCETTPNEQNTLDDSHFENMLMKNIQLWKFSLHKNSDNEPNILQVR
ncbi:uncharacterized protein LOC110447710 [Mizuhopecten yessoensis]|uniref:Uncharacterized protein n=1 Tax=Mizuhopecten yessoensis TaxID=6573 RepID=A0A210QUQ6_MIZYE|nr:uncharacterized protein LOC110447710 [Mizuhopecten yessoensis]XP_021349255.1 uncharacterized protein LOC110447710 [Mizuhopecten yessoensis]XP_021349256.1 uncharacterized protein LOC110447710 [Mizuhopecten yessoensis]XP_021349257.1 uncharacterized protein LOC110447710 [Mizuhopecten yessoensis]OWF52479.1 hypothetical protein KP79_PYT06863 [Mizuhopecten yessoensis]